jgi:hypothetical protein
MAELTFEERLRKSYNERKQEYIIEAIAAGPDGPPCGCWKLDCGRGCGIAIKATARYIEMKKTLVWAIQKIENEDDKETIRDLIESLTV